MIKTTVWSDRKVAFGAGLLFAENLRKIVLAVLLQADAEKF